MEWQSIAVRERVIDNIGIFRWGDDLFVNQILNFIVKEKAIVSMVTVLLVECAILGSVMFRWERVRERSRIEQFEIPFLHQYPQCTG